MLSTVLQGGRPLQPPPTILCDAPYPLVASRCSLGAGTHERTLFGGTFVIQQVGEGSQNESWSGILLARGAAQKKKW